jgi:hypothetical protein
MMSTQSAKAAASFRISVLQRPFLEAAVGVEAVVADMAEIGFGLLHHRHVEEDAGLAQLVVGAEAADRARRGADDRRRLLVPHALAIGPRADVDRVLEHARERRDYIRACRTGRRRRPRSARGSGPIGSGGSGVVILVVERQVADLDDVAVEIVAAKAQIERATLRLMLSFARRLPTTIAILCQKLVDRAFRRSRRSASR